MRPVLTRAIIRQILRNEPIIFRGCIRKQLQCQNRNVLPAAPRLQRRSLFGFSMFRENAPRQESNPGLDTMVQTYKRSTMRAKLLPALDMIAAWRRFLRAKIDGNEMVLDTHTQYLIVTFRELQKLAKREDTEFLTSEDVLLALEALTVNTSGVTVRSDVTDQSYMELATELYSNLKNLLEEGKARSDLDIAEQYLRKIVAQSAPYEEATGLVLYQNVISGEIWSTLLSRVHDAAGLQVLSAKMRALDAATFEQVLPRILAANVSVENADWETVGSIFKELSNLYHNGTSLDDTQALDLLGALHTVICKCSPSSPESLDVGASIIQFVMDKDFLLRSESLNVRKWAWQQVFKWAVINGRPIEELDRMMKVSVVNDPSLPVHGVFSGLLEYAAQERQNPYLTEKLFQLTATWELQPRAVDFANLVRARLIADDTEAAISAFQRLQGIEDLKSSGRDRETIVKALNALIVAMCRDSKHEADSIMQVVDLLVRYGRFDASTIRELSLFHLRKDEYHEVVDLLKTHAPRQPLQQRRELRDAFLKFCLDRRNKIKRVWDTFIIFHQIFEMETNREIYTPIMREFYTRRRGDMGLHVFNIMRDHWRPDTFATEDTYVTAFKGITSLSHTDSLFNVHNQLKLDMNVDPTTKIYNALMMAYTACGSPHTAWTFWRQITSSIEGPSFESIMIVLRVCERMPFGEQKAFVIWNQFQRLDIEVTPELFASFIGALTSNEIIQESKTLIETAKDKYAVTPDEQIIGTLLNCCPSVTAQQSMEDWVVKTFPDIYVSLKARGIRKRRSGHNTYHIKRELEP